MSGKGSRPRQMMVSREEWRRNYERAFGKKPKPMPPGTYWDECAGKYVEPTDPEYVVHSCEK